MAPSQMRWPTRQDCQNAASTGLRLSAAIAPLFLLAYGVLRLVDGADGEHGPGIAWNIGHTLFLLSFIAFSVLIVGLRRQALLTTTGRRRVVTDAAVLSGMAGVCSFLWVIIGDLFPPLTAHVSLPDPLYAAGPVLFQLGLMTLLVQLVVSRPRQLAVWSPPMVFLGFAPIAVDLDLLPVGAVLILCGLAQLASSTPRGRGLPR